MDWVWAGVQAIRSIQETSGRTISVADLRLADPLDYWVCTLACMHDGITTLSPGPLEALPLELHPTAVFVDAISEARADSTSQTIDSKVVWSSVANLQKSSPHEPRKIEGSEKYARIFFTSGTTGVSKAVGYGFDELTNRCLVRAGYLTNHPKSLTMMAPYSSSGFQFALNQWILGHAIALDANVTDVVWALVNHKIDQLVASPSQIKVLLQELKLLKKRLNLKAVTILGGVLTPRLFNEIRVYIEADVYTQYGATETGTCAVTKVESVADLNQFGVCCPGVVAEVVNEMGQLMPEGEEGLLRIKSPYMANNYLIADDTANQGFWAGWFYPGDLAVATNGGNDVRITGRANDVLNTGGTKVNLLEIDDYLCAQEGVADAATFFVFDDFDYPQIWAAVVGNKTLDLEQLLRGSISALGVSGGPKRLVPVQEIPRTFSGKAQRNLMGQKVRELLKIKK